MVWKVGWKVSECDLEGGLLDDLEFGLNRGLKGGLEAICKVTWKEAPGLEGGIERGLEVGLKGLECEMEGGGGLEGRLEDTPRRILAKINSLTSQYI